MKLMSFGEMFLQNPEKFFAYVSFHALAVRGVEPDYLSRSRLLDFAMCLVHSSVNRVIPHPLKGLIMATLLESILIKLLRFVECSLIA